MDIKALDGPGPGTQTEEAPERASLGLELLRHTASCEPVLRLKDATLPAHALLLGHTSTGFSDKLVLKFEDRLRMSAALLKREPSRPNP